MSFNSRTMFEESIKSEKTLETYTWYVEKFVDFYKLKDFDSILKIPKDELQKMVETYVIHVKKRVSPNSVSSFMKPIKLFLEVNDVELRWKKITRLYPAKVKASGNSAWQTEDIQKMLDSTTDRLSGSLILTNKDGDYTKANGNLQLYVKKDGSMVHSATFDVTRNDFASWKNNNGEKITGYSFSLKKYFSSGPHDVLVDFVSGPEKSWIDLHDTFWSIN